METGLTALNQIAAIAGLGGIGKTQTAVEYAYRYFYDTHIYDWVFWVKADTELAIVTGIADIARSLNLGDGNLDELAARAKHWLETNEHWLLICDNADQPQQIKSWLPRNPQGRILLTSRAQQFAILGIKVPLTVNKLSQEESIAFLCDRINRPSLATDELAAATALARALDGLPLALEQAAAYLQRTGASFTAYWKRYQQQPLTLLEKGQPETGDYPQSVATTWLLNFEAVETRSPASVPILQLSAVLAPDDISEQLLLACAEEFGLIDCTDELALGEQLAALADFSLIQRERETASYSIHRMVQDVVWDRLTTIEQQTLIQRAIVGLCAAFPNAEKFENWALCGQLAPHVQTLASRSEAATLENIEWPVLLNQTGCYLRDQARYGEAEPLLVRSFAICEQQLGANHADTATCLNNLALLYYSWGRYGDAEPLYVEALDIRKTALGKSHPDTASSLDNLAELYRSQGRYVEAELLYVEALKIRKNSSGDRHPDTAASLNNLAVLYDSMGRYVEAEPLYVEALKIKKTVLGDHHPDTAYNLGNLAELYESTGRYSEAEPLLIKALEIIKVAMGDRHPSTATSLNNLAALYQSMGRYSEAEPLYIEALEIRKTVLGESHPNSANTLWNMAALYYNMRRYHEALPLIESAAQIFEQVLPPDHPRIQNVRGWLQTIRAVVISGEQHDLLLSDELQ